MKHFMHAVAAFKPPMDFEVAVHDSALVRGRTLLDFFGPMGNRDDVAYVTTKQRKDLIEGPGGSTLREAGRWYGFISERTSHISFSRDVEFDQWPDRDPGQEKGDDRLVRLAHLVLRLADVRIADAPADCQPILQEIVDRAGTYLADPTSANLEAMDPRNLSRTLRARQDASVDGEGMG